MSVGEVCHKRVMGFCCRAGGVGVVCVAFYVHFGCLVGWDVCSVVKEGWVVDIQGFITFQFRLCCTV